VELAHHPPYDLAPRRGLVWLDNGITATEVVRRLVRDVTVLLKIYTDSSNGDQ